MKKSAFIRSAIGFAALGCIWLVFAAAGCRSGGDSGNAIATVDGEPISMDDWHKYLEIKPTVVIDNRGQPVTANVVRTLGYQAMDELIREKVLYHLARDENVYPTDADVAAELDYQKKLNPQFLQNAQAQGLTVSQVKDALIKNLVVQRLLTKGITITKEEIDQYIKDNPSQFRDPETVDMLWILVNSADLKKQVDSALTSGQSFQTVAIQYSKDPNVRKYQGIYPVRAVAALPPDVKKAVEQTSEGKTTGWVEGKSPTSETFYAKFFVEKRTPAKDRVIDDLEREKVRRYLALQRGRAAIDLDKKVADKLKESKIDIDLPQFKDIWSNDLKASSEAASESSGTPAPPTTPAAK